MEASNQVVVGAVEDSTSAVKQLMVGAKVLQAKGTFLTTLESFRGDFYVVRFSTSRRRQVERGPGVGGGEGGVRR